MTKIFITGFRHSGTTMVMQLIKSHPQVGFIENEEGLIAYDRPKNWVLLHASKNVPDLKKYAWGEKLPWATRDDDLNGERIIGLSKKWLKYFRGGARILHIVRHPFDVAMSGTGKIGKKDWKYITTSVPLVIDFMNSNPKCATVVYEDLVTTPRVHLRNIFQFLNLNHSPKIVERVINTPLKFGKINADRAFAFKNKKLNKKFDYENLKERIINRV